MNADSPLVSVTIPAYNHECYVQTAIESVMKQSYENIELIIIDDGSTDKTVERAREVCEAYEGRIHLLTQENRGLVSTLNRGIAESHGAYWCQLASDDKMDPKNIEKKVEFLEKNRSYDAVCSDSYRLDPDGSRKRMVPESRKPNPVQIRSPKDLFHAKIFFPSFLFRRSLFKRIGNFDESCRYYEDIEMKPRLLLCSKVGYTDEPLLTWRSHGKNTSRNSLLRRKEKITAYEKLFSLPGLANQRFLRRRLLGDEYYKYARCLMRKGKTDSDHSVSWYLRRSLALYPFRLKGLYYLFRSSLEGLPGGS